MGGARDECAEVPSSESESSEKGLEISTRGLCVEDPKSCSRLLAKGDERDANRGVSTLLTCRGGSGGEVRSTKFSSEWLVGCKLAKAGRGV